MERAILIIERESTPDIFGHYDFKVMAIRFETIVDKILNWFNDHFRRKIVASDIKTLDIFNVKLPKELACTLNVVPTPSLCNYLYKSKTKEDHE